MLDSNTGWATRLLNNVRPLAVAPEGIIVKSIESPNTISLLDANGEPLRTISLPFVPQKGSFLDNGRTAVFGKWGHDQLAIIDTGRWLP